MDGYQLTAVIFQSIAAFAWPIALLIVAAMFRTKLAELLPNLRGKYKDVEFWFQFWFQKAEAEAKALTPSPQKFDLAPAEVVEQLERFDQIAKISPQAAMLELRALLDERLRSLAEAHGIEKGGRPPSMLGAIRGLQSRGVIDQPTAALLQDLRSMGNTAAHATDAFSLSDAIRYRRLVEQVLPQLRAPPVA
jgi:hypothetical protein